MMNWNPKACHQGMYVSRWAASTKESTNPCLGSKRERPKVSTHRIIRRSYDGRIGGDVRRTQHIPCQGDDHHRNDQEEQLQRKPEAGVIEEAVVAAVPRHQVGLVADGGGKVCGGDLAL